MTDFGFVFKTIDNLTVYEQAETPHVQRVDAYLAEVSDFLNIEVWKAVKATNPNIHEFHVTCFLSDKAFADGQDARFKRKYGEFEVWCGVDKAELTGLRLMGVREKILDGMLSSTILAMRKRNIGGADILERLSPQIVEDIPKDKDRNRRATALLAELSV